MLKMIFRPLQNFGLRILLLFFALALFTSGGLFAAAWLAGQPGNAGWQTASLLLLAGGLLLFKARSPGKST